MSNPVHCKARCEQVVLTNSTSIALAFWCPDCNFIGVPFRDGFDYSFMRSMERTRLEGLEYDKTNQMTFLAE